MRYYAIISAIGGIAMIVSSAVLGNSGCSAETLAMVALSGWFLTSFWLVVSSSLLADYLADLVFERNVREKQRERLWLEELRGWEAEYRVQRLKARLRKIEQAVQEGQEK